MLISTIQKKSRGVTKIFIEAASSHHVILPEPVIDRHQLGGRFVLEEREGSLRQRVQHLIMDFRLGLMEQRLRLIQQQLRQASNDMEHTIQLLKEHKETKEIRDMLAKKLGTDIL